MGLDQYLRKQEYVSVYDFDKTRQYSSPKKTTILIKTEYEDGHTKEQTVDVHSRTGGIYMDVPYAYWRKANAIHRWFVDFSQEEDQCQEIKITGKQLKQLIDLCEQVLKEPERAGELLPTQDGFFFGSTKYDEYYYEDLEYTLKILKDVQDDDEFIYQASW